MKAKIILVGIVFLVIILTSGIFSYQQIEFERKKEQRESVADMVAHGEIEVQPNGLVILPNELKKLSDSGECVIVGIENRTAIYFYSFRGLLESSKGYLYFTDKISYTDYIDLSKYVANMDFVDWVELEANWYSCSTN